ILPSSYFLKQCYTDLTHLHSFPTRRSSDLAYRYNRLRSGDEALALILLFQFWSIWGIYSALAYDYHDNVVAAMLVPWLFYYFHRSEEHTSELQSRFDLVCRLLLEKKKKHYM